MEGATRQVMRAVVRDATYVPLCFAQTAAASAWVATLSVAVDLL